jgi:hypothetical protein
MAVWPARARSLVAHRTERPSQQQAEGESRPQTMPVWPARAWGLVAHRRERPGCAGWFQVLLDKTWHR